MGVVADAGVQAAHDAGQGQGLVVVSDDQGVRVEVELTTVEQGQALTRLGQAHPYSAAEALQVEGVHRLAEFEHHIIGDVDQWTKAADAAATQAFLHPQRGHCPWVDVADDATDIVRAGVRGLDGDRKHVVDGSRYRRHGRLADAQAVQRADLAGDAGDAEAVAAVGGQVDVDDGVVEGQGAEQIAAGAQLVGQVEQPVGLVGHAELSGGAEHAEGFDPAQRGAFDAQATLEGRTDLGRGGLHAGTNVGRAADDGDRVGLADIDRADPQAVGVGMGSDAQHLADDDAGQVRGNRLDTVDFEPGHGQLFDQAVAVEVGIDPLAQPLLTEFHGAARPVRDFIEIGAGSAGRFRRTAAGR